MPLNIKALADKVNDLSSQVDTILKIGNRPERRREYERWYSQARRIVEVHLPGRLAELEQLYFTPSKAYSSEVDTRVYLGIRSDLRSSGSRFQDRFHADIELQRGILLAVPEIIDLRALEVAALVTADIVDSELGQARVLLQHGFIRAAGAVSGVALEAHLKLLHNQSGLDYKEEDTIVPLATRLRKEGSITVVSRILCK